ncbi:MAG TPA: HlyD family efflux transporter periplasmic adaptor subunit [Anaerolineales bacterium]|nr:HlyD family efflux transporter periplasmic adaptor subunit [Anaerolineales bacterium]
MKKSIYSMIILTILAVLVLIGCTGQQTPTAEDNVMSTNTGSNLIEGVIAEGHLEPVRDTTLSFQGVGTVAEVSVETGDQVKEGDVLARLGGSSDAAYAAAQLELASAQQALKELQDSADERRAQSLVAVDEAQEAYDKAVDYYESLFEPYEYDELVYIRKVTPFGIKRIPEIKTRKVEKGDDESIADAKEDMDLKLAQLEAAQRAAERMKDGPDTDQLALLQARLDAAQAGVAAYAITAPFDGFVMDINVTEGEQVGPQTWVVKIADTSSWNVETSDVTELEVINVQEGQAVTFTADALPDAKMTGVVSEISQASYTQSGDVIYTVRIQADEVDPRARWGMTVEVVFEPLEN